MRHAPWGSGECYDLDRMFIKRAGFLSGAEQFLKVDVDRDRTVRASVAA
jgi:hypothetical protein